MQFEVELRDIQPVTSLVVRLDLSRHAPLCIVVRNGAGKTTLAKAVMNFALADTFSRTTSDGALRSSSAVRYALDGETFHFTYDASLGTLNSRKPVPERLRSLVSVELSIPHGQRFSYFHALAEADPEIRRAIILEDDQRPDGLINFLTNIYRDRRFKALREVRFSRGQCCFFRVENQRYVREDSFSSGEFFLVNLYRRSQFKQRLVFIDEIDISLDAAAQARLMAELRSLCTQFQVNVVFTSHSLALMQTLGDGELLYLDPAGDRTELKERSFAYVKSLMFGFSGWDRYILVEDEAARLVIQHLIDQHCEPVHHRYMVLEIGGVGQTLSLLRRNRQREFLAPGNAVIAILDGDQAHTGHVHEPATHCMPLHSLEHAFARVHDQGDLIPPLPQDPPQPAVGREKAFYKAYRRARLLSETQMVEAACEPQADELCTFANTLLRPFLNAPDRSGAAG